MGDTADDGNDVLTKHEMFLIVVNELARDATAPGKLDNDHRVRRLVGKVARRYADDSPRKDRAEFADKSCDIFLIPPNFDRTIHK